MLRAGRGRHPPSFFIPARKHFLSLQYRHWFLLSLSTTHCLLNLGRNRGVRSSKTEPEERRGEGQKWAEVPTSLQGSVGSRRFLLTSGRHHWHTNSSEPPVLQRGDGKHPAPSLPTCITASIADDGALHGSPVCSISLVAICSMNFTCKYALICC